MKALKKGLRTSSEKVNKRKEIESCADEEEEREDKKKNMEEFLKKKKKLKKEVPL